MLYHYNYNVKMLSEKKKKNLQLSGFISIIFYYKMSIIIKWHERYNNIIWIYDDIYDPK